jgi:hypothetical protein
MAFDPAVSQIGDADEVERRHTIRAADDSANRKDPYSLIVCKPAARILEGWSL